MSENRLNIISVEQKEPNAAAKSGSNRSQSNRDKELQAKFERLWLLDPEQFNPLRNCMEKERIERTWQLLRRYSILSGQQIVDIGCGTGVFSKRLCNGGAYVEAVDIAENALKYLKADNLSRIHLQQEAMPNTTLPDHHYDVVVCTDVIADLYPDDYRLFFAELSRLIKPNGYLICSSAIDIESEDGVEKLVNLAQTEFDILDVVISYHALFIRIKRFFETPSFFVKAGKDSLYRKEELTKRKKISRWWFWLNTSSTFNWCWRLIEPLTQFIVKTLNKNRQILLRLEKICRFIWSHTGISHYLFIAKRRPLKTIDPRDIPVEAPKRKEIWD